MSKVYHFDVIADFPLSVCVCVSGRERESCVRVVFALVFVFEFGDRLQKKKKKKRTVAKCPFCLYGLVVATSERHLSPTCT